VLTLAMMTQLNRWTGMVNVTWGVCYRRSRDGTGMLIWINQCRNTGPLMIAMSKVGNPQCVVGGYTNQPGMANLAVSYAYVTAASWLFSFNSVPPKRFPLHQPPAYFHNTGSPYFWFGGSQLGAADFLFDTNTFSSPNFPYQYLWEQNVFFSGGLAAACTDFVGGICSASFLTQEMEVWYPLYY